MSLPLAFVLIYYRFFFKLNFFENFWNFFFWIQILVKQRCLSTFKFCGKSQPTEVLEKIIRIKFVIL